MPAKRCRSAVGGRSIEPFATPYPAIGCHPGGTGGGTIPARLRWLAGRDDPTVPRLRAVTARAGEDRAVTAGQEVVLDGSGSHALPGGVVGATWRQVTGPLVDLRPDGALAARFQAPATGGGTSSWASR